MGVYHFMGLGRSVGAVTAAISYLRARYERWDERDQLFFSLSGEVRQKAEKRGDVEALILFTTPEVHLEQVTCEDYVLNRAGHVDVRGQRCSGETVPQALHRLLREDLLVLAGGRPSIELYWCEVARDQPTQTFERVAAVMAAAKPPGRVGKEIWINLTGGTNIINAALQLAASLLGMPARLYYILTDYTDHVRYTVPKSQLGGPNDRFWVELPIVYLDFRAEHRLLLEELATDPEGAVLENELYNRVKGKLGFPQIITGETLEDRLRLFRRLFLVPLRAQRLVLWQSNGTLTIGPGWEVLSRYYDAMPRPGEEYTALKQLEEKGWFSKEELSIVGV